jgi:hypothetical protein
MTYSSKQKIGGYSRKEGIWRISTTLPDNAPKGWVNLIDFVDYDNQQLILKGLEAGPGVELTVTQADNRQQDVDRYKKIVISAPGSGSGSLQFQNEGTPIPGVFTTVNFIGADVLAQPGLPNILNVYIPPPAFLSHWNTGDGTNGNQFVVESNINRTLARISNPTLEGTPFLTGGWAGTNQFSTRSSTVTFVTPDNTTGFGGDSYFSVLFFDGNGTAIVTYNTPPLVANGVYSSGNGINVTLTGFAPDATRFQARASVEIDVEAILNANGYAGGRYNVWITHHTDTATDGTGPYTYISTGVFLDVGATPPQLNGTSIIQERPGFVLTKHLSGVEYYILNSQFSVAVTDIDGLNSNVQRIPHNFELRGDEYGLPPIDTAPYTPAPLETWTGWNNFYNTDNVNFNKLNWAITATNYRYIGPTGNISVTARDTWGSSTPQLSPNEELLIDTFLITSTNLAEFFDDEDRRQVSTYNEPSGLGNWNSTAFLSNGEALVMAGLLQVPNQSRFVRSDGPATVNSNWTTYKPDLGGANPDYTALGAPVDYYRTFIDPGPPVIPPLNKANFTMTFTGEFAAGNALNDLIAGNLQVFIRRRASAGGGQFGVFSDPLWLHAPYNFGTFADGVGQTAATAGIRLGSSVGNQINGTYGGFSCETGMLVQVRIVNPATRIGSIVVSY